MSIDDVYKLMQYIINKNQQGFLTPDEFNTVINAAQTSFLDYLLGSFQQYQAGRSAPRLAYSNNEITRQRLTPLIKETTLNIASDGKADYPNDYMQADAMLDLYNFYRIRFLPQDSQFSTLRSTIDPVETNPVFLIKQSGFQFYPKNFGQALLSYVSVPDTLNWAYTNSIYGIPTWDSAGSTNPQWYDVDILEIIARALRMVGVNLQSNDISKYADEIKTLGQ